MSNKLINPFIYSRAVCPGEFVGREHELRLLFSRLATGQSTAVIGMPHVGKTSLLTCIKDYDFRTALFGKEFDRDLFHILDAQMLRSVKTQAEFWEHALSPLAKCTSPGDRGDGLAAVQPVYLTARENKYGSFVMEQFFTACKEQSVRYILFLDEFDDLLSHPVLNSAEFYGSLRSLASRSLGLVLVLGSRRDVEQLNFLTQSLNPHGSPYFNTFTQITLKALGENAFHQLIQRAEDRFNAQDIDFIRAVSGRFPFLIQAAAAKIWDAEDLGLVGFDRYKYAGRQLYNDARQHFADSWRVWTNEVRRAATTIALNQIPHLLEEHSFAVETSLDDYAPEVTLLEDLGMLVRAEEGWRITQGAFLWWLADELKRNVRSEMDFHTWLLGMEMDGFFTHQQKEHLARVTSNLMSHLGKGAGTLIETFAKSASSAALKQIGMA